MNDSRHLAELAAHAADDKKASAITLIDVEQVSSVTDYFLVCSGNTPIQVRAIAEHIEEKLEEAGKPPLRVEGVQAGRWILLDYGVVVAHVMLNSERDYYSLERLWNHGKVVPWANGSTPAQSASA